MKFSICKKRPTPITYSAGQKDAAYDSDTLHFDDVQPNGVWTETAAEPVGDNYSLGNSRLQNSSSRAKQTISIDFPGGTIGDYIDLVKKDADSLNLIVTDGAKDLVLPKIALKNVPVDVAVNCIEQCFDPSETVVNVSTENRGIQIIQAQVTSRKEVDVINVKRLFDDKKMTEERFIASG